MNKYIAEQLALHPSMMPQDVVKMCFQAAYGAEHLLTDIPKVREYFLAEYNSCEEADGPVAEFIAPEVCRINLGAWKKLNLPWEWLFNLFVQSASISMEDGDKHFFEYVDEWLECFGKNCPRNDGAFLHFSFDKLQTYVQDYLAQCPGGKPQAVHHSQQYRDREKPAYRVISGTFVRLIPILVDLRRGGIIAIDGRAASGKSTLAAGLRDVIGAEIIHMDDFFLPPELRTEARLSEPGGNIHYERFAQEVLPHLKTGKGFEYRIFDCTTMTYSGTRKIAPSPWLVVEGSYSHHPHFGNYADHRVFSTVDSATQMERITARNGAKMAAMFAAKWIPMEEAYFKIRRDYYEES